GERLVQPRPEPVNRVLLLDDRVLFVVWLVRWWRRAQTWLSPTMSRELLRRCGGRSLRRCLVTWWGGLVRRSLVGGCLGDEPGHAATISIPWPRVIIGGSLAVDEPHPFDLREPLLGLAELPGGERAVCRQPFAHHLAQERLM